jgi:hypothetical protein
MEPTIIRAMERILVALIGGLCAYLGYRTLQPPSQSV